MSMGAFTILRMVGSEPDLRTIASHCAQSPEFICDVLRTANPPLLRADAPATENSRLADSRIKAVVLAAPGYGFTLVPHGLDRVRVPIQLWSGESDTKVPYQTNAGLIRAALGTSVDFHSVPGAGHFSFLVPCGLLGPPDICSDQGQFDRSAFHAQMNASAIAFFDKNLKKH
jgi:predicted dienelactone hydrolase